MWAEILLTFFKLKKKNEASTENIHIKSCHPLPASCKCRPAPPAVNPWLPWQGASVPDCPCSDVAFVRGHLISDHHSTQVHTSELKD